MNSELNTITLRRKNFIVLDIPKDDEQLVSDETLVTLLMNLESIGYTLSLDILNAIKTYQEYQLKDFSNELTSILRKNIGGNKKWNPMYPNFPKQVAEASDCELYINAFIHYFGAWLGYRILPEYEKETRTPLGIKDKSELTQITLGTVDTVHDMFNNLMSSKTSISDTDKEELSWYLKNVKNKKLPVISHKEILSFVTSVFMKKDNKIPKSLEKSFQTATDVLRLAVALSEGDVSLAEKTKFINFKRPVRRLFMKILEGQSNIVEDMVRYKKEWIRLGERIHPGEFKKCPKTITAFNSLRNNLPVQTFNSELEKHLLNHKVDEALALLKKRPGIFARRLDHLIRLTSSVKDQTKIAQEFNKVAKKVATPVLLQVLSHFRNRTEDKDIRIFFPKGNEAKFHTELDKGKPLHFKVCDKICRICVKALKDDYAKREDLGKVYVDHSLESYLVPFSQRSANKALKTIARGSKVSFGDCSTLRSFLWWKDIKDADYSRKTVDIDLSMVFFSEKWKETSHISYTRLRDGKTKCYHSGDITSAPHGACEFIDIDIDALVSEGNRYAMMSVLSYNRQPFSDMQECFCGWMERSKPNSGEVFEAKTVKNKIDIFASSRINVPIIIDLVDRKIIYADINLTNGKRSLINVEANMSNLALLGKTFTEMQKVDLYTLFTLNAEARGTLVDTPEEADIVFSEEGDVTPYDIEEIISQYL